MKLLNLIKMCLPETFSRFRVDEHMSDMFPRKNVLKQRGALLPLVFNFALKYVIRWVNLKLYSTHQLLVYAGDVNMLDRSAHTVKEKHCSFSSC